MSRIIKITALILLSVFTMSSCGFLQNSLHAFFEKWEPETRSDVAIVDWYGETVIYNGEKVHIYEHLENYYGNLDHDTLFLVSDGAIYGVHKSSNWDEKFVETVELYSYNIDSGNIDVLYTGNYCPQVDGAIVGLPRTEIYYRNRNFYFYDGVSILSYNIDNRRIDSCQLEDLESSIEKYSVTDLKDESGAIDFGSLLLTGESIERVITIDYLASISHHISELSDIGHYNTIMGKLDPLEQFFHESFIYGDTVYFLCCVYDEDGEKNALIFSYDPVKETVEFLYHRFTVDTVYNIYVIPAE